MFALTLLQVFFAIFGFVLFYNYYYKRRNLPPGPTPLPVIGNVLEIAKQGSAENAFLDWKRRFGPIYTYWVGEKPFVAVADYKLIIDTFQKDGDAYAGRPVGMGQKLHIMTRGEPRGGVIFTQDDIWREHRRFTLHVLRDFGLSKDLMQERVLNEVSSLLSKVHSNLNNNKSGEQDLPALLDIAVGSVINTLLFGYRFDESRAQEFYELKRVIAENIQAGGGWKMKMLNAYPQLLHKLPPFDAIYEQHKRSQIRVWDFYQRQIDEHVKNIDFDTDAEPTDYAEAYLREKRKHDAEGEPHSFTYNQLKGMCQDLFIAGQETTSTTLAWGVAYLIHSPEAQKRLHEELDSVIGSDRLVTMSDRPHMHYTNAVINEVQRLCNMVPQNVPHSTTRDVTIEGYHIPKGTVILPQISTVLYDEEIFPQHATFKPERFLDIKGHLKRTDELIPFSVGKRQCLGESLARMELFLFLANIFNQFKREEIAKRYKETFDRTLSDEWSHFSDDFKEFLRALCQDPVEYDANQLYSALKAGKGLALMEILFTRSQQHLDEVKELYRELYNKEVDEELADDKKLHDRLLLKFLVDCQREVNESVDLAAAEKDAQSLCHPDKEKQHVATGKLYEMLATKSFAHLRSVFDRYEQLGGESVEQLIECDFPGDDEGLCLKAAVNAIRQPATFFATELSRYYDEEGNEISNDDITRIIVSRSEVDLADTLEKYSLLFGKPFDEVCKQLGGDYGKAIHALITRIPPNAPESLRFPLTTA